MVHGALAESEEERRLAKDRARPAETSPRNYSARADAEEELLRDMEVLMGEKIDAESRLEQETSRRREAVNEVRKAADEEKQQLLTETENKTESLRDQISQLKSDLVRCESDCYTVKDENADLRDQIGAGRGRLEAKSSDLTSKTDELGTELSRRMTPRYCSLWRSFRPYRPRRKSCSPMWIH